MDLDLAHHFIHLSHRFSNNQNPDDLLFFVMTLKTFRFILNRIDIIIDGSVTHSVGFIPDGLLFYKRFVVQVETDVLPPSYSTLPPSVEAMMVPSGRKTLIFQIPL